MKKAFALALAVLATSVVAASAQGSQTTAARSLASFNCKKTITLPFVTPLTGGAGFLGAEQMSWAKYAVKTLAPGLGLKVKLVGAKTNRAAVGVRIEARLKNSASEIRSIYRTVGNNGSFGGNSLVESIGLGEAASVDSLTVSWPTSDTTQVFREVSPDRTIEITEGAEAFRVVEPQQRASARR